VRACASHPDLRQRTSGRPHRTDFTSGKLRIASPLSGLGGRRGAILEKEDDGVVAYTSAYIEGPDSTRVVRSGHSSQETPEGIAEVLRILELHLSTQEAQNAK
jgi:hypothetical protein